MAETKGVIEKPKPLNNPELGGLRRAVPCAAESHDITDDENPLSAARGVAIGLLLAIPSWGLVVSAIWLILHAHPR